MTFLIAQILFVIWMAGVFVFTMVYSCDWRFGNVKTGEEFNDWVQCMCILMWPVSMVMVLYAKWIHKQ